MSSQNPETSLKVVGSVDPVELTASSTSITGTDTLQFEWITVSMYVGTVTGTTPTMDLKMQECDTLGGTYADISGAAFTQVIASNDDTLYIARIKASNVERFLRPHITISGTSPVYPMSVSMVLTGPETSIAAAATFEFSV